MKRLTISWLSTILIFPMTATAFGWGAVSGPRGGAAYRGLWAALQYADLMEARSREGLLAALRRADPTVGLPIVGLTGEQRFAAHMEGPSIAVARIMVALTVPIRGWRGCGGRRGWGGC